MTPEDEEFNRIEQESKLRKENIKASISLWRKRSHQVEEQSKQMTQDEIIEMARKAGFSDWAVQTPNDLLAFAKLVAEKERVQKHHSFIRWLTTPPQRTWVGLTEKDKEHLSDMSADPRWNAWIGMEQTEALLKEKNT